MVISELALTRKSQQLGIDQRQRARRFLRQPLEAARRDEQLASGGHCGNSTRHDPPPCSRAQLPRSPLGSRRDCRGNAGRAPCPEPGRRPSRRLLVAVIAIGVVPADECHAMPSELADRVRRLDDRVLNDCRQAALRSALASCKNSIALASMITVSVSIRPSLTTLQEGRNLSAYFRTSCASARVRTTASSAVWRSTRSESRARSSASLTQASGRRRERDRAQSGGCQHHPRCRRQSRACQQCS